jgi:outer membrane protein assembly factor BamA
MTWIAMGWAPGITRRALALAFLLAIALVRQAAAIEDIATEEDVSDLLVTPRTIDESGAAGRRWAILPLVGYGNRTKFIVGAKFVDRDLFGRGLTLGVEGAYTTNGQSRLSVNFGNPYVDGERFLWNLRAGYDDDPQYRFFALGANTLGPDPFTTHRRQRVLAQALFGWRPLPRLAINATASFRHYDISRGDVDGDTPSTVDFFPELPGIHGGSTTPLALSAVYNTRDDLLRPTQGWRVIARAVWDPPWGKYEFARFVLDAGYLYPIGDGRQVIGARVDASVVPGPRTKVPFWELASAGGDDTVRGYVSDQFLGRGRAVLNTEYRVHLGSFNFYDLWIVGVDGALFFDVGSVFISDHEIGKDLKPNAAPVVDAIRKGPIYAGGPGVRFTLSQALVARIDMGFSDEQTPIIYLAFGHTF